MPTPSRVLIGLILILGAAAGASAQGSASIAGVVRDASGAVLPGVTVEASSPALIEKTRSAVTDGAGQYKIEQLRGGIYAVTFTLSGFSTLKREGIELAGSFAATMNADLKVGSLSETLTVTGEAPVVDIQSATKQRVVDQELLVAIPTGRTPQVAAFLIPGVNLSNVDVGGTNIINTTGGSLSVHGGSISDTRLLIDGVTIANTEGTGWSANMLPNMGSTQEVAVDYSAVTAESITGGLQINMVPKTGGNRYLGDVVCHRRQHRVSGKQHRRGPGRERARDAEQPEAAVGHQSGFRRAAEGGPPLVLHLRPLHESAELRRRPVPEPQRRRHHEVDVRAQHGGESGQRRLGEQREPPPDLAGDLEGQAQLLLRSALSLPVRGDVARHLGGGGEPDPLSDQRSEVGVVHGDAHEPDPDRSAVWRAP